MRLFVAVNISDEIKNLIINMQDQLRSQSLRGNFSQPKNLHITLAFLGETPADKLEKLARIIEEIKSPPFEVVFNRSGCFTHSHKELWWIGADKGCRGFSLLNDIHGQLLRRLEEEGFPVDTRPFNVHITLGREIKHAAAIVLDCPEITIKVDRISLMKSEHIKGVLTYTELMEKKL